MANFNKVLLMGNLTRDPQLRYLPSQMAVVEFGIAVNRRWKGPQGEDREEVTFVDCTAWGKQAETINQYCQKGKGIFIEGRLKYDTWEDKQGGGKRSKLAVVVENFQFIGGRDGAGASAPARGDEYDQRPARPAPGRGAQAQPDAQPQPPISNEPQFKDDDIPF
ncbi:MAG TPA: single-stranded DNA-binding protein [Tepidisphaeraceae bacterium]|nr:single-stranded DNA-binding protein [Tepidisphaeraceae bacterium]